jgi:hypothetical protein
VAGTVDVTVVSRDGDEATLGEAFAYEPLEPHFYDGAEALPTEPAEVRGRAVAAADLDGDGDLDLVQAIREGTERVLINEDGHFSDETAAWMPESTDDTIGVAVGDVNGDGLLDVVTANLGAAGEQNRLYLARSEAATVFEDVTGTALPALADASTDLALFDSDGDGDLDLLVANWKDGEAEEAVRGVRLLVNDGSGDFAEAPDRLPSPDAGVFGLAVADFDADGDPDLFLAADTGPCLLYLNDGAGVFSQAPPTYLPSLTLGARLPAVGDVDGDGSLDLLLPDVAGADRLFLGDGTGRFEDFSIELMPADPVASEHAALADVDLDGDLDAVISRYGNGPDLLYRNDGTGRMFDYSSRLPDHSGGKPAASAVADFNLDGTPDIFISVDGGPGHLFLQGIDPALAGTATRADLERLF